MVNTSRALPTFGILLILAAGGLFGNRAAVISAIIFAIPLILSNAYTGVAEVDPDVKDAARGMGMSSQRSLWLVEVPLALPLVAAGLRTAIVQVIAVLTLAAFVGGGGLGVPCGSASRPSATGRCSRWAS
ncbi:ABC transporter permease subunit [Oerskovia sp. M15]